MKEIPKYFTMNNIKKQHVHFLLVCYLLSIIKSVFTYGGDMIFPSLRLVFGCFCIISSWPSKVLRYCICCGDGTGIKLGSLTAPLVGVVAQVVVEVLIGFCCAIDCRVRPNIPSTGIKYLLKNSSYTFVSRLLYLR